MKNCPVLPLALAAISIARLAAHEVAGGAAHDHSKPVPVVFQSEKKGPVRAPKAAPRAAGQRLSGQGFWTFSPVEGAMPVPAEAQAFVKGAHGTLIVDVPQDTVYWGLEKVGWVSFKKRLTESAIVKGDPAFTSGNIHGADILPRKGQLPLVVAADNVEGEILLSDTTFTQPERLRIPDGGPYADKKGWAPTDAAFAGSDTVWITDGYGRHWFMDADAKPFKYRGNFYGGDAMSRTPHGITFDVARGELYISARPEAQVHEWSLKNRTALAVHQLPPGSLACDTDLWGDYLLVPCLEGPAKTAGPIYIMNLKTKAVVSTIRPKEDLGYEFADHMHDACWYIVGKGRKAEVYILFTAWNPGGIGALKMVNISEK
jgi:hypothetical protein